MRQKGDNLTDKQRAFCIEYAVDKNGTQAAIRAGYSAKAARAAASTLLTNPNVRGEINQLLVKHAKKLDISAEYVLKTIKETIERCMQQVEPRPKGKHLPAGSDKTKNIFIFDAANALRGSELLGRYLKLFTDKVEHTGADGGPIQTISSDMDAKKASELYQQLLKQAKKAQPLDS